MSDTMMVPPFNRFLFDELLEKSRDFVQIIEEETAYLKSHELDHALSLLPRKKQCASFHQELIEKFTKEQDWKVVPLSELKLFKELLDQLTKALIENEQTLKIVHAVHEGVMTEVTRVICEVQAPVCQYTKKRRQTVNKSPVSMAVMNQTV